MRGPSYAAGWSRKLHPSAEAEATEAQLQEEHQAEDYEAAKARLEAARPRSRWRRLRRLFRPGP